MKFGGVKIRCLDIFNWYPSIVPSVRWDQGILGMCVGEKRKLKIPAKLGYGEQGSPPTIPGGATLIFDTELVAVNGKGSGEEETDSSDL
ncbi:peptidyl-prolyl cis-trans isomerase FKBP15-1-like protein [Tanacetum coccineum]